MPRSYDFPVIDIYGNHRAARDDDAAVGIYVELVRSIYGAFIPALIMSIGFVVAGSLIAWQTGDVAMTVIVALGTVSSVVRLFVALRWQREAYGPELDVDRARLLERRFAITYLAFSVVLCLFGIRAFMLPRPEVHMLTTFLLIGYGAGVAAGIGLRPWIAIPALLVGIIPGMIVALFQGDPIYWATSAMSVALVGGGIRSLRDRHQGMVKEIGRRITFGHLARIDALTALPNRLALTEWFEQRIVARTRGDMVAVHCLDLDGFKPVNDSFGHPVGDALLGAVADRLSSSIRASDIVARLGGDEFAVVQYGIQHVDEAALLAQRLAAAIGRPFQIEDREIRISTCVGYVTSGDRADDLERLIACADAALYDAKRFGGGVMRHQETALSGRRPAVA